MKVTIKDIAKELGLAVSTVSRALNGSYGVHPNTIEQVKKKAKELGYIPNLGAQQMAGKSSQLIGIFFPEFDIEGVNPDFFELLPSIQEVLREGGKDVIIFPVKLADYRNNLLTEWVRKRNLEGCIFLPGITREDNILREAQSINIPAVNFGKVVGDKCSAIGSNSREGGRMITELLIRNGHKIIGFINGPDHLFICKERYAGFYEVLQENGITHNTSQVIHGNFNGKSGEDAAIRLINENPDLTAIVCANDLMAMGAISALAGKGAKVPADVSVTGFDGLYYTAYMNPPLTTVNHSSERIGTKAAEMLLELLNDRHGYHHTVTPILIERKSVSDIRQ
ncbi:transcriptional regulator, LacI family [Gracilibacillus ureilyticus]|uniref:Transcriptional regulator, LacI family n=1 Tax=Gracilibacillus ureilyticus TaxID=531814 RepID=A0A1H9Q6V5_9BACI|nr:LacI family DNA-binding transcriptional regulator [Gracilibacillus ureilyticus]SER56201.1 transcriptional regulator, LacI family [Gracilibacillus ureilyticus]